MMADPVNNKPGVPLWLELAVREGAWALALPVLVLDVENYTAPAQRGGGAAHRHIVQGEGDNDR